jgi:hypothetical protein
MKTIKNLYFKLSKTSFNEYFQSISAYDQENLKEWQSLVKANILRILEKLLKETIEDLAENVDIDNKKETIEKILNDYSLNRTEEDEEEKLMENPNYTIMEKKGNEKFSKKWEVRTRTGKLLESTPLPLLNSVDGMKLIKGSSEEELKDFGLDIKDKSQEEALFLWINRKENNIEANRYLRLIYKQLLEYRELGQVEKYWKLYFFTLQQSEAFFMANLSSWNELWYKEMDILSLINIRNKLRKFAANQMLEEEELKNVWIESPKGKWRCLSVPGEAMRLYSHILNNGLVFLLRNEVLEGNHGFINARGCSSAWKEILETNLLDYETILQLDVSSGFPNLHKGYVQKYLQESKKIPIGLLNHIMTLLNLKVIEGECPTETTRTEQEYNKEWKEGPRGLPMGLGISPFLYVYTVTKILKTTKLWDKFKWINYADDLNIFIKNWKPRELKDVFKDKAIEIKNLFNLLNELELFKRAGLQFNEEKFSICKLNGEWKESLKLLGLRFDGKDLFAGTRGRGDNPITKRKATDPQTMKLELISRKDPLEKLNFNWLISSKETMKFQSLIQSYLYNGGKLKFMQKWMRPSKSFSIERFIKANTPKIYLKRGWISKVNVQQISQNLMLKLLTEIPPISKADFIVYPAEVELKLAWNSRSVIIEQRTENKLEWISLKQDLKYRWNLDEEGAYFVKYSELKKRNLIEPKRRE